MRSKKWWQILPARGERRIALVNAATAVAAIAMVQCYCPSVSDDAIAVEVSYFAGTIQEAAARRVGETTYH